MTDRSQVVHTSKYGDAIIPLMHRDGIYTAMFGDDILNEAALNAGARGKNAQHPLDRMMVTLSGLERDDRFEKARIYAHDSSGNNRILRLFTLKDEFIDD